MFSRKRKQNDQVKSTGENHATVRGAENAAAEKPLTQRTLQMLGITVLLAQLPLLLHLRAAHVDQVSG